MRGLGAFLRQILVVKLARRVRIQSQVELVLPTKFKAGFADGVVAILRAGMAFREIGGVSGDLVGDDPSLTSFLLGKPRCSFGRDIAKHRRAVPAIIAAPIALVM